MWAAAGGKGQGELGLKAKWASRTGTGGEEKGLLK